MEKQSSVKVFEDYFNRKISSHKDALRHKDTFSEPFITISRETGAGDVNFALSLVNYLNTNDIYKKNEWRVFEKNILDLVVKEHDLPAEMAKYIPDKKISELQNVLEQLFELHPSEHSLLRKAGNTILHLAILGDVILVGRGAQVITKDLEGGVHIRLIDSPQNKIRNIRKTFSFDEKEAKKFIRMKEREKKQYVKKYLNSDIEDLLLYSIIINLSQLSTEEAVQLIGDGIIKNRKILSSRLYV